MCELWQELIVFKTNRKRIRDTQGNFPISKQKICKQTLLISLFRVLFALYLRPKRFRAISSRRLGRKRRTIENWRLLRRLSTSLPVSFVFPFSYLVPKSEYHTMTEKQKKKNSRKLSVRQHKGRRKKDKKNYTPSDSLLPRCFLN